MIDIKIWMQNFLQTLNNTFGARVWFVGLQGSYGRGEATENSDIDVVVILDELSAMDVQTYNAMLDTLPHRELICGFLSGKDEIMNWDAIQLDLAEPPRVYVGINTFSENRVDNLWELLISTLKIAGVEVDRDGEYLGRLEVSTATVTHLKNIRLGIWYQPEQLNLTEFVNNICTLGQINIYIGFGDKIVISKI